jgi:hypothetical protein
MSAPQLQAVHRELFVAEHPIANCQHLRRKIARHLQAAKDGGLPESVRQYAIAVARGTELRLRISENASRRQAGVPLDQTATTTVVQTRDARLPMPGSLIVKQYKDQIVVVKVLDERFEYDGCRFTSLSAIAGEIPAGVLVSCADNSGSSNVFTVTEGTHDATNVKVTVTTSAKYKILAWL